MFLGNGVLTEHDTGITINTDLIPHQTAAAVVQPSVVYVEAQTATTI